METSRAPLAYRGYRLFWSSLDWLYPPTCGGCGQRGSRWCRSCQESVLAMDPPLCERCGQQIDRAGLCGPCMEHSPSFTAARSWAVFKGPVREAIHRLKYRRDISLAEALSRPLIECARQLAWQLELVVPVPLGVARLNERGYNQATLLARPLALGLGVSFSSQALSRVRETRSQVGLSYAQRRENVSGAFQAQSRWVTQKNVLVVDDVATSSATLEACAAALRAAGAGQVYGLTLARAGHKAPDTVLIDAPLF